MKFEITKYNKERAEVFLKDVTGKNIMIGDTWIKGVHSIRIEEDIFYDGDPEPEIGYDGGKHEHVQIIFKLDNGTVSHTFNPDEQICTVTFETDELWIFKIENIQKFVERMKSDLDFRLEEYQKNIAG